jgi:hypothetical protein
MRIDDTHVENMESLRTISNERERNFLVFRTTTGTFLSPQCHPNANDGLITLNEAANAMEMREDEAMVEGKEPGGKGEVAVEAAWGGQEDKEKEGEREEEDVDVPPELMPRNNPLDMLLRGMEMCEAINEDTNDRIATIETDVQHEDVNMWDFQKELNRDITDEEEKLIQHAINQDLKLSSGITSQDLKKLEDGCINMDIIRVYLKRVLSNQDEKLCENDQSRFKSVYFMNFLDKYYDARSYKYIYKNVKTFSRRNNVPGGDIFKTNIIFIPIHEGNHFTCAVIYMQDKQITIYDSYLNANRSRNNSGNDDNDGLFLP